MKKLVGKKFKTASCPLIIPYFPIHLEGKLSDVKCEISVDANLATVKTSIKYE